MRRMTRPLAKTPLRTDACLPSPERVAIAATPRTGNRGAAWLCVFALLAAWPAAARADSPRPHTFNTQQRAEIVAIVRQALHDDPSILRDAIDALQQDEGNRQRSAVRAAVAARSQELRHNPADPVAGNPNGDVTVVEFYDPRCPYCRAMRPVVERLLAADPGVRLVYKDIPVLGADSKLEARALLAAQRQGGYLPMQAAEMTASGQPTAEWLRRQATRLGLNGARLVRDMADPAIKERLGANVALAQALGIEGTPSFVIGEQIIPGAVPLSELRGAVAAARRH